MSKNKQKKIKQQVSRREKYQSDKKYFGGELIKKKNAAVLRQLRRRDYGTATGSYPQKIKYECYELRRANFFQCYWWTLRIYEFVTFVVSAYDRGRSKQSVIRSIRIY